MTSMIMFAITVATLAAVAFVLLRSRRFYPPSTFAEAVRRMRAAMVEAAPVFAALGVAARQAGAALAAFGEAWTKADRG